MTVWSKTKNMQTFVAIWVLIFGSAVGSFLNVVTLRLPFERSLKGRSACPNCHKQLSFWQLWPVVSFVLLSGKCANCGKKISWRYPVVEIICGLIFLFLWMHINPQDPVDFLFLVQAWVLAAFAIAVFIIDFEHFLILDSLVFPVLGFFLAINLILDLAVFGAGFTHSLNGALGALAGFIPFYLIWRFSEGRLMGFGDAKLMLALGAAVGWPGVVVLFLSAVFLGSVVGLALLILGRKTLKSALPFGCFLSIGGLLALLYGKEIIHWYLSLLAG